MDTEKEFEVEIYATKAQIEEFISSLLWGDLTRELLKWKKGFVEEAIAIPNEAPESNPSTATVLMHLGDVAGRANAVDYFLSLPEMFLQILEDKKEAKDGRESAETA